NGKGVITNLWHWLLGPYSGILPFASVVEDARRGGSGPSPDLADLVNKRVVFAGESNPGNRLDVGRLNALTGGVPVKTRHLNKPFFDLHPGLKLVLSFNNKPVIGDPSQGIWRRMMLVHFTKSLPREEWDLHLLDKFKAEAAGILNYMVDGFRLWREQG